MKSSKEKGARFKLNLSLHPSKKYDKKSIERTMEEFLTFSKLHGKFKGHAAKAKQGSNHTNIISVKEFNPAGILMYVQPEGNGSRRGVWLTVPKEFAGKAEELFNLLRENARKYNN